MYVLTKPTAAKARPVLAVRDIVICSVILLVLCLQNKLQGCQSAISAATWRGFSCFSLVAMLLALNCTLNPTSAFQHLVLIYTSRLLSGTAQKSVKDHLCRSQSHSVLPATDQSLCSLIVHEAPLCANWSPYWWGDFCGFRKLLSPSALPQSSGPILLSSLFLFPSLFHPIQLYGNLFFSF